MKNAWKCEESLSRRGVAILCNGEALGTSCSTETNLVTVTLLGRNKKPILKNAHRKIILEKSNINWINIPINLGISYLQQLSLFGFFHNFSTRKVPSNHRHLWLGLWSWRDLGNEEEYQKDVRNFWKFEGFGPHLFFFCIMSVWVLQALSDGCLFTLFLTSQEVYQQDWGHRGTKVGSMADVKRSQHLKHLETHDPASPMEILIVLSVPWWSSTSKHTPNFKKLVFFIQLPFSLPGNDFAREWYHFRNNVSWCRVFFFGKQKHPSASNGSHVWDIAEGIFGLSHKQLLGSEWVENDSLTVKFELEVRPDDWHLGRVFQRLTRYHGFG